MPHPARRPARSGAIRGPRCAAAAVALLVLVPPAAGQSRLGDDVTALVDCPWPKMVDRGYVPVFVELENGSPRRQRIDLEGAFEGWGTEMRGTRSVVLEPNSIERVEVLVPAFSRPGGYGGAGFQVRRGNTQTWSGLEPNPAEWSPGARTLMVFAPDELGGVERARLEKALYAPPPGAALVPSATAQPSLRRDFQASLGVARFDRMPSTSTGYSSLNVVALDARKERPPAELLDPLVAWVRTGGTLVALCATPGGADLASLPFLEGAFEDRFRLSRFTGGAAYRCGLGRLYLVDGHAGELDEDPAAMVLRDALLEVHDGAGGAAPWLPNPVGFWRLGSAELPIPGLRDLPLRVFLLLLVAFAVVIGPVNLMTLRRIGRPGLLLVTIPAISAVASLGILAYGVLYQGLDTKLAHRSRTVLDQRIARAATVEWRQTFVGLAPGHGLRPGLGTTVGPRQVAPEGERYTIDQTGRVELSGSFLPVRTPVEQVFLSERPARLHLAFEADAAGAWTVHNRLETALEGLWLVDPGGDSHVVLERVPPGASATLGSGTQADGAGKLLDLPMFRDAAALPGTYLARVAENPFLDDCGLGVNVLAGEHLIQGILPAEPKEWSR